jgi:hypothetical protein
MSTELLYLPTIETRNGRVLDVSGDIPDLRYGFVLHEQLVDDDVPGVHTEHTQAAKVLMTATGLITSYALVVPEYVRAVTKSYSPPHMDGLAGRYYQVNTVHQSSEGQHSAMVLNLYELNDEEHEAMMVLRANGFGVTPGHGVEFHPPVQGMFFGAIAPALDNTDPVRSWFAEAGPNSTIVFPNGYDAGETSMPGDLFVHHFSTVEVDDHEGPRTVSLSRIEPLPAQPEALAGAVAEHVDC